ncbi:cyclopropane-fatty-acyl-phospholipid synthase family protein [Lachnospiraceae bacterium JLR.KK008]
MSLAEKELIHFMGRFKERPFQMVIHGNKYLIGEGEPDFTVIVHRLASVQELLKSTSLALGEAYMHGDIEIEGDLYQALYSFLGQMGQFSTDRKALKHLIFTSGSKNNQKKEVTSHYDIGNDFYSLWLDETMSYSCGYFQSEEDSLYEAQCHKVDRILEKLYLQEGMRLCDIGCGWGFLLIEAAKKYKIYGTGITLSIEQKKKFEERIREEHLEQYLTVELMDYRDLSGLNQKYDRVVSVGMLEHVGRDQYETFMNCVKKVMKPGGVFLLHFISALSEYPGDAWIKKYIFPGGVIPSLREIIHLAGDLSFYTVDVESLRRHYSRTLLCWNENFQRHKETITEKFGEEFTRMWELYLCSCAATFMNGVIDLHQIVFTNGVSNELPMTRWY